MNRLNGIEQLINGLTRAKEKAAVILLVLVLGIYAVVVLFSKANLPLMSYDEAWYASIARNMIEDKRILHQTFNGSDYYDHPPLGFWLMSLSMMIFGGSETAVRLPSMLAGIATLGLVYLLARKRGSGWTAWLPVLMLASSMWYVYRLRSGNLDGLLVFFLVLVIYTVEKLVVKPASKVNLIMVSLAVAGLFLTKTLVGLGILPTIWLIWKTKSEGEKQKLAWLSLRKAMGLAVIMCLPWYIYSSISYRDFLGHHFLTIGTRQGMGRALSRESLEQTLLYFRSGVGKWYYSSILSLIAGVALAWTKYGRKSWLNVDLIWFLGVGAPFLLSPKTEVWHLIPLYVPLFLLVPSIIEVILKLSPLPGSVSWWVSGVSVLVVVWIAGWQVRAFLPLLHQSIEFDRKDIAIKARQITTPIEMKASFLPAFVYYSNQINVHPLHLEPKSYDLMVECLTDQDCNHVFVIDKSELPLLDRDRVEYNLIASNSGYLLIDKAR